MKSWGQQTCVSVSPCLWSSFQNHMKSQDERCPLACEALGRVRRFDVATLATSQKATLTVDCWWGMSMGILPWFQTKCQQKTWQLSRISWFEHGFKWIHTSSAAQGGGGSFKNRKPMRGWLLWITDGRANPLMDRQVVGAMFFGAVAVVAVVASPQLLDVVWCSAVVVVVVV